MKTENFVHFYRYSSRVHPRAWEMVGPKQGGVEVTKKEKGSRLITQYYRTRKQHQYSAEL